MRNATHLRGVLDSHLEVIMTSSQFERMHPEDFAMIRKIVCAGNCRFYVVVFRSEVRIHGVSALGQMMTDTISAVLSELERGGQFYVGVFQRHQDGGCHRVCYREALN